MPNKQVVLAGAIVLLLHFALIYFAFVDIPQFEGGYFASRVVNEFPRFLQAVTRVFLTVELLLLVLYVLTEFIPELLIPKETKKR